MGGANGSRECAPDDKLRDTHQLRLMEMMGFADGSTHPAGYVRHEQHEQDNNDCRCNPEPPSEQRA
jgi:hypothetical protein